MADSPQDEFRKLMRAYAGLQMATTLVVAAKANPSLEVSIVISLFAISIPSTIAYSGLARITKEDETRNPHPISGICGLLTYVLSMSAFSILLWPAARFAAIAFPITSVIWWIIVVRLRNK